MSPMSPLHELMPSPAVRPAAAHIFASRTHAASAFVTRCRAARPIRCYRSQAQDPPQIPTMRPLRFRSPKSTAFCARASRHCEECNRTSNDASAPQQSRRRPIPGPVASYRGHLSLPYARGMDGAAPSNDSALARRMRRRMHECAKRQM
jgi:hypothetical protein